MKKQNQILENLLVYWSTYQKHVEVFADAWKLQFSQRFIPGTYVNDIGRQMRPASLKPEAFEYRLVNGSTKGVREFLPIDLAACTEANLAQVIRDGQSQIWIPRMLDSFSRGDRNVFKFEEKSLSGNFDLDFLSNSFLFKFVDGKKSTGFIIEVEGLKEVETILVEVSSSKMVFVMPIANKLLANVSDYKEYGKVLDSLIKAKEEKRNKTYETSKESELLETIKEKFGSLRFDCAGFDIIDFTEGEVSLKNTEGKRMAYSLKSKINLSDVVKESYILPLLNALGCIVKSFDNATRRYTHSDVFDSIKREEVPKKGETYSTILEEKLKWFESPKSSMFKVKIEKGLVKPIQLKKRPILKNEKVHKTTLVQKKTFRTLGIETFVREYHIIALFEKYFIKMVELAKKKNFKTDHLYKKFISFDNSKHLAVDEKSLYYILKDLSKDYLQKLDDFVNEFSPLISNSIALHTITQFYKTGRNLLYLTKEIQSDFLQEENVALISLGSLSSMAVQLESPLVVSQKEEDKGNLASMKMLSPDALLESLPAEKRHPIREILYLKQDGYLYFCGLPENAAICQDEKFSYYLNKFNNLLRDIKERPNVVTKRLRKFGGSYQAAMKKGGRFATAQDRDYLSKRMQDGEFMVDSAFTDLVNELPYKEKGLLLMGKVRLSDYFVGTNEFLDGVSWDEFRSGASEHHKNILKIIYCYANISRVLKEIDHDAFLDSFERHELGSKAPESDIRKGGSSGVTTNSPAEIYTWNQVPFKGVIQLSEVQVKTRKRVSTNQEEDRKEYAVYVGNKCCHSRRAHTRRIFKQTQEGRVAYKVVNIKSTTVNAHLPLGGIGKKIK
ncbi:MAG TPA: hypothetical protein VGE63_00340 [Candidatus Paceibacterota bacterium]